ncbi:MAG: site-specific integrase [Rhodococcus sp. (in: high G+C Gram-positive bacteria)]|uniref:tyrosine-type recombinase/integrase n=1 Tax=Nocardiaceae TaxID=85025 RepID=UPI0015F76B4C|nr:MULTISPECIES: site-specific integrase [Rhodococcus]MCX6489633.1 site-specific integrase [Rhodococcus sp. (in: high G+C Gram-positive bacteria)]WQH28691.1 site-specific integrase [Rhodococcus fascians]
MNVTPTELPVAQRANPRLQYRFKRHEDLADSAPIGGAKDLLDIEEILDTVPVFLYPNGSREHGAKRACRLILEWLLTFPGAGWQERWVHSGADVGSSDWLDTFHDNADPRTVVTRSQELRRGLILLLVARVVFPSYESMSAMQWTGLYAKLRTAHHPEMFTALEARVSVLAANSKQCSTAMLVACKIVLHTGRDLHELTPEDLLGYRAWNMVSDRPTSASVQLVWAGLDGIADLRGIKSFAAAIRRGPRPTGELVDRYNLVNTTVRNVLVRYLDERRPSLDYGGFAALTGVLAGNFWADIELHDPGLDTIDLPPDVAAGWKQRLSVITDKDGTTRPRAGRLAVMMTVRGFYRDIAEWAAEDPTWVQWSVPNPIRKSDVEGYSKERAKTTAVVHQRIRERLPHLPSLVDAAHDRRDRSAALLAATASVAVGETFEHLGVRYRRSIAPSFTKSSYQHDHPPVLAEVIDTGEIIEIEIEEHEAFWAWAVIETFRHTGIRVEELLELTHLAVVSYTLPSTGEIVPMLQIVPSKTGEERLLLVSPELASVLATIIARLRTANDGTVPLTARYDGHERITDPPLPHLFQHRMGWLWTVPTRNLIQKWLNQTLAATGIVDNAGNPLRYTAHDFRRMFATESVGSGLPIHIVAKLLGHKHISTTQIYTAVFDEELVRSFRTFLDARRAQRPEDEYRSPTDAEWNEFQQHFEHRKLELGTCGRPYNTPCKHEHACIRCPSQQVDPNARVRLTEIIANLRDRIAEARNNGWTGEAEGLQTSLTAAATKLVSLDRTAGPNAMTSLGIPAMP